MATMITEVYTAVKDAGVSDEKAQRAAEAMATYDPRLAKIEADVGLLKWMMGFRVPSRDWWELRVA